MKTSMNRTDLKFFRDYRAAKSVILLLCSGISVYMYLSHMSWSAVTDEVRDEHVMQKLPCYFWSLPMLVVYRNDRFRAARPGQTV